MCMLEISWTRCEVDCNTGYMQHAHRCLGQDHVAGVERRPSDARLMRLYATRQSRHQQEHVAMVTRMLLDGQVAWRHHGLMRIKSAEIAGLHPSSRPRGVCCRKGLNARP